MIVEITTGADAVNFVAADRADEATTIAGDHTWAHCQWDIISIFCGRSVLTVLIEWLMQLLMLMLMIIIAVPLQICSISIV